METARRRTAEKLLDPILWLIRMKVSASDIGHLNFLHSRSFFCTYFRIPVFTLVPNQPYGTGDLPIVLA